MRNYQVVILNTAKKDLKRLDQSVQIEIWHQHLKKIEAHPFEYPILTGRFREYRKYVFTYNGISYRIIFSISPTEIFIYIVLIGTRENLYKE